MADYQNMKKFSMKRKIDIDLSPALFHFYSGLSSGTISCGLFAIYFIMNRLTPNIIGWELFTMFYFFSIFFEERTYKRFLKAHVPDSISSTFKVKYFIKKDFFCFYSASSLFIEYLIDGLLIFLAIKAHFSPYLIVSTLTGVKILGCLLQGYSATFYNPADQLSNWFVSLIIFVSGASYYFLSSSSLTIFISIVCFRAVFCNYKVLIRGIHATIGNAQMN